MRTAAFILVIGLSVFFLGSPAIATEVGNPRLLVHLLDYLAKDYGGAVANGNVTSQSEYNEQVEFIDTALKTNQKLSETKSNPEIEKDLERLNQLILRKRDADEVAKLARSIQARVIEVAKVEIAPTQWPSIQRGKELYAQSCVACHGTTGAGDGPAGKMLKPLPANFLDAHMNEISPFQAFNTIRLGVQGTGMASFPSHSDKEVWDLAFYVVSLRHKNLNEVSSPDSDDKSPEMLRLVATSSDDKLKEEKKNAAMIASLRTYSSDDEGGGGSLNHARTQLDEALKEYKAGNQDAAKTKAIKAYLEGIEPVEPRLKATDPAAVSLLETKMAAVRSAIEGKKSISEVENSAIAAKVQIDSAEKLLKSDSMSPWIAFLAAAAIILREGFEAVLVIIALLGVIRAAGAKKAAHYVHGGWVAALGLGVVTWFLSGWLMGMSGAQRETLEGATSLFAVAVLLIVGFWLHSQTEIGRWKAFIHGKVQRALEGKKLYGLASIAFIAVFREAFETVLFLRAIWLEGGEDSKFALVSGVVGSIGFVIFLAWALLRYSEKIPIRKLFGVSSVIMLFLAFVLTGKGFHSFQETGAISVTASESLMHFDLLGLYPTWETLSSQIFVFSIALGLWWVGKKPSQRVVERVTSA
jgi:high-affinity iron transporter